MWTMTVQIDPDAPAGSKKKGIIESSQKSRESVNETLGLE